MPDYIIYTDLDGTLLDHHDYDYSPALPALRAIKKAGAPLVMVSSKTRPEMEALRTELGINDPFIVENGGAVFIPRDSPLPLPPDAIMMGGYGVIVLGKPREEISPLFDELAKKYPVRALSRLSPREIASLTGLTESQAGAAGRREFGEALVLDDPTVAETDLSRAVESLGLRLTRGGRFYHLLGENDKGRAVKILTDIYRKLNPDLVAAGIGDAPNDQPLLAAVDHPFLVAAPDGTHRDLDVPKLTRIPLPGPRGFNRAVLFLLNPTD